MSPFAPLLPPERHSGPPLKVSLDRCTLRRAEKVLAGLAMGGRIEGKADDNRWPLSIWEIPVEERTMPEYYLCNAEGSRFDRDPDDKIGSCDRLSHACPLCGQQADHVWYQGQLASQGRFLPWLAEQCIENGKATYACQACGEFLTAPAEIFAQGTLEKLQDPGMSVAGRIRNMTLNELLVPNWSDVLVTANSGGAIEPESLEWDGKGRCPVCDKGRAEELSQRLKCIACQEEFWVDQKDISRTANTNVRCSNCNCIMTIPPAVWCPKCSRNILPGPVFRRLFSEANNPG